MKPATLPALFVLASAAAAPAVEFTYGTAPGTAVPDSDPSGYVSTINVPDLGLTISGLTVSLNLRGGPVGGWNGDVYAYLAHNGVLGVLLNRPGRTAANSLGYADDGFLDVTFADAAPGDIHLYQALAGGPGPATGLWQPDARATDPDDVLDTDARTLFLGGFDNLPAAGEWRLFVTDLSPGGSFVVEDWGITFQADPGRALIPEPGTLAGGAALALLLAAGALRQRERRTPVHR